MYQLTFTDRFKKNYKSLHPNEQKQVIRKIDILSKNPMHPSLRVKRIQGMDDLYECSVNMDIRVIWYYEDLLTIILADVDHHDILKQF